MSSEDKQTHREMDFLQRDRFELLSAYLDSEVTAAERKQVQEWLTTDPAVQRLYTRLTEVRRGLQTMPVPQPEQSAQHTAKQVFERIDHRRTQKAALWGGAAIAAMFIGAVSGILPGGQSFVFQMAESPQPKVTSAPPVMVALNEPVVEIPKAAVTHPEKSIDSPAVGHNIDQELN